MKNFSTVGTRYALAALFAVASAASAAPLKCEFRADAPDRHVVVKGDTLWDISGVFLQKPWCWPTVWGMNRDEIANPHWIYPGQIIWFDRAAGRLRLGNQLGEGVNDPATQKLEPRVRTEGLGKDAVPSIPPGVIEPFLTQPLIIEDDELKGAPRIVATQEGRVFLGKGDKAYVRGELKDNTSFQVFRPGTPLKDPITKQVIGYEAFYLGTLKLQTEAKAGSDVHTFTVATANQEMGKGDQLRAVPPMPMQNYAPHPPEQAVEARIVAVYGGVTHAGQNQIVSINRGKLDGLDVGSVLQLYHAGRTVSDSTAKTSWFGREQQVKLPDEEVGSLFIFRTFKHISYGLIMQVRAPVEVGDVAKSPE
ncbi:LysM domain-containing protein [Duganella sp. CF402]|uniref:LysM peptidoglycan-binding domain-containing protein n=1 Tax=unclassified Duganella TaxID=2636909 RepID=UPI0008BC10F0|nr:MULTISPECIES: LysM peptidoglycan-binding domain-containing protein [unclassified Duganella]RZT03849.1 LysM domain-containing protein [Duganella sp. BK701]SEM57453.1 LysM domain-containing protein [Duganella sp. CF402]